jgi:PilZ domain
MRVALSSGVALGLQSRNQRSSPRVDVLLRVKGELVPVGSPIRILNLNRTGFAVLSEVRFRSGQRLHVRLTSPGGPMVEVTAAAVHTQPRRSAPGVYATGFMFQPERPGADLPEAAIRALLAAVAPVGFKV